MSVTRGARERARAEITAEIVGEARRQLAVHGAAGLSLRSVARALGMVSSAVYRYVASRDDLLTRLIVDAYDAVGGAAERAAAATAGRPPADRWVAVASAVRSWACANEHEYALVYGSPVPGYAAPEDTIGPASRVPLALTGVVLDARRTTGLDPLPGPPVAAHVTDDLRPDLRAVAAAVGRARLGPDATEPEVGSAEGDDPDGEALDEELTARLMVAWTQLFGLVSFELFGQTAGLVNAHDDLFAAASRSMAAYLGLPSGG